MEYLGKGTLTIKTIIASGALPLSDVLVNVRGADEENRFVEYSLFTDGDGLTETLTLPTPDIKYSLTPNPTEVPYAKYDITAIANGYYPISIIGASVFANTHSLQVINMIPTTDDSSMPGTTLKSDTETNV